MLALDETIRRLEAYCREREWAGYDPYDALNSPIAERTPFGRSPLVRLALTQILKRSPVNPRPMLGIRLHQNPKALGLFLSFYAARAAAGDPPARDSAGVVASRLLELRSPDAAHWCWGYSFPWQMRRRLVPRFAPNLVCTTFAAHGLLDAYEAGLGAQWLGPAVGAGAYLAAELFWEDGIRAAYAYPLPDIRVPIHNANLLGAALVCRLARVTGDGRWVEPALRAVRYSVSTQRGDGSWVYGDGSTQQWVDNFHTGFNLCALQSIARDAGTGEFDESLRRGYGFYRANFFGPRGEAKYFHNRTYPIDIHSVAQSLITLHAFAWLDPGAPALARSVYEWAMARMWDERGFFYYRVLRGLTIRTSYMRWSQAWMLSALGSLADDYGTGRRPTPIRTLRPL
jgi:hypothetical protein